MDKRQRHTVEVERSAGRVQSPVHPEGIHGAMRLVLFDIDATLLSTGAAGADAMWYAFADLCGIARLALIAAGPAGGLRWLRKAVVASAGALGHCRWRGVTPGRGRQTRCSGKGRLIFIYAAGLTDHIWPLREVLLFSGPAVATAPGTVKSACRRCSSGEVGTVCLQAGLTACTRP
jgi:hypothetical protein